MSVSRLDEKPNTAIVFIGTSCVSTAAQKRPDAAIHPAVAFSLLTVTDSCAGRLVTCCTVFTTQPRAVPSCTALTTYRPHEREKNAFGSIKDLTFLPEMGCFILSAHRGGNPGADRVQ